MKATGIIRRIDDLGRVVIPKEIRRNLGIQVGDPLEIFTDVNGGVCFKKYIPCLLVECANPWISTITARTGCNVTVYDSTGIPIGGRMDGKWGERIPAEVAEGEPNIFKVKAEGTIYGYIRVWGMDTESESERECVATVLEFIARHLREV